MVGGEGTGTEAQNLQPLPWDRHATLLPTNGCSHELGIPFSQTKNKEQVFHFSGVKFPGVVAVHCVVPSGLVLHIRITSCTFSP